MTRLIELALKILRINDNEVVRGDDRADETVKNLYKSKKLKKISPET